MIRKHFLSNLVFGQCLNIKIQNRYLLSKKRSEKGTFAFCSVMLSSYGSVLKARYNKKNTTVAIKIIPISELDSNDLTKEINILRTCKNQNIVKYYGSYRKDNSIWVF